MSNFLNIWSVDVNKKMNDVFLSYVEESKKKYIHEEYLLKDKTLCHSVFEKFIHEIIDFHLVQLGWNKNKDIYASFFLKYVTLRHHSPHRDILPNLLKNRPVPGILSILTYFTNHHSPTILTNIQEEDYQSKNIHDKSAFLIFPQENKQITFQGGHYYHTQIDMKNEDYTCILNRNESDPRILLGIILYENDYPTLPIFDDTKFWNNNPPSHDIVDPLIEISPQPCIIDKQIPISINVMETMLRSTPPNKEFFESLKHSLSKITYDQIVQCHVEN